MSLHGLISNNNAQKILLFLFVNRKCFGAQLQRTLNTSLTPLQNALEKLEKGQIITSYFEGKTRVYEFNSSYPLLAELEMLLKKAYTLLPAAEKKQYSYLEHSSMHKKSQQAILMHLWDRLKAVKELHLFARSQSKLVSDWEGHGKGEVSVSQPDDKTIVFHERGRWLNAQEPQMSFSNTFRFTLDKARSLLSLEHLRFGAGSPVFLFHLTPTSTQSLSSIDSHFYEENTYCAKMMWDQTLIRLSWRGIGPNKNEEIQYQYL